MNFVITYSLRSQVRTYNVTCTYMGHGWTPHTCFLKNMHEVVCYRCESVYHDIIPFFFSLHYVYSACHGRPLTLDTHSSVLNSTVSPKWQKLGELLGMDEHRLDEIFTNNKTNEEHLRAVLEVWLRKSNNSKWSDVDDTFSNIGKDYLAGKGEGEGEGEGEGRRGWGKREGMLSTSTFWYCYR